MKIIKNQSAQAMLEYATVAAIVLLAILVMGPYVVRSINAFFKGIEAQVEDALVEELEQSPETGFDLSTCECGAPYETACGAGACTPFQIEIRTDCSPPGCEIFLIQAGIPIDLARCEYRDTCCTDWVETGNCGDEADVINGGNTVGGCPDEEMEYTRDCGCAAFDSDGNCIGGPIVEYSCQSACAGDPGCVPQPPPHPACMFDCVDLNGLPFVNTEDDATMCPDDDRFLPSDLVAIFVPYGGCTARKCEWECAESFIATPSGCICGYCMAEDTSINQCLCAPGCVWYDSTICPVQHCVQGPCGPMECTNEE